jgi:hypothetical protein
MISRSSISARLAAAVSAALLASGCSVPEGAMGTPLELGPGSWVEIQGRMEGDKPIVEEVEVVARGDADTPEKIEITGPSRGTGRPELIQIAGQEVEVSDSTQYEDASGKESAPYALGDGEWFRVKTRIRSTGALKARSIEPSDSKRFEIEGEVTRLDPGRGVLTLGPVVLDLPQEARINLQPEDISSGSDPLRRFQADEQTSVPFTFRPLPNLGIGGQVTLEVNQDRDRNLGVGSRRDKSSFEASANLDLLWTQPDGRGMALFEVRTAHDWEWDHRDGREDQAQHTARDSMSRAYYFGQITDTLSIQFGRHDFDEEREWLYDEVLDGGRLIQKLGDFEIELAAAAGRNFADLEDNSTADTGTFVGVARYYLNEDHWLTGYALDRTDSSSDRYEPQLYGLRSFSRPYKGLGHWLELSLARGRDGAKDIRGEALDVGLMYRFEDELRTTLTVGYAYGSGRDIADDAVGYRQSGLHDNNSKFGGVTSFKYYGEVFEPDLSNLDVTTLGIGIRPVSSLSADLVLHTYRQDVITDSLFANSLRARPNGRSADLGHEIDLVVGYRRGQDMTAELVAGRFDPGSAFDGQDAAYRFQLQFRFKF